LADSSKERLSRVQDGEVCCSPSWEQAYLRFETPEQERRKFLRRLRILGASDWPRDSEVVELFCGRGNGLEALRQLGFRRLEGVDLSESLLAQYRGEARCYVADCRSLPFADRSKDVLVVQGGLHHLERLPEDLVSVLGEARRVLRPGGRLVVVEPWLTPFLSFVHAVCEMRTARRLWSRLDALATMNELEATTYLAWLARPAEIRALLEAQFRAQLIRKEWGKLLFVGRA
jgi:ubiquinone/menaquinone biosynthesis C-methylase UbiE